MNRRFGWIDGSFLREGSCHVEFTRAKPSAPVVMVVGFAEANSAFKGGVLVPTPDQLVFGLMTGAGGEFSLASTWSSGVPSGVDIALQAWITDGAGPQGFAASNAVKAFAL